MPDSPLISGNDSDIQKMVTHLHVMAKDKTA